jgi:hypothetical protein
VLVECTETEQILKRIDIMDNLRCTDLSCFVVVLPQIHITEVIKHINGKGGACSAQSGRGKQRPDIMDCDV